MSTTRLLLREVGQESSDRQNLLIDVRLNITPNSPVVLGSYDGAVGTAIDSFAGDYGLSENGFDVKFVAERDDRVEVWAIAFGEDVNKPVFILECNDLVGRGVTVTCFPHTIEKGTTPRRLRVD